MLGTMNQNIQDQRDDLKAFERRVVECIAHMQPSTSRWRMVLVIVSTCTAVGAWLWLVDPSTSREPFLSSLWQHPFFTLSSFVLILLFFGGIHKRVVAPSIIAGRLQTVLDDFNMSCDECNGYVVKMKRFDWG